MKPYDQLQDSRTIQKCMKILTLFEQLEPRKLCTRPHSIKKTQSNKNSFHIDKTSLRKKSATNLNDSISSKCQSIQRTPLQRERKRTYCFNNPIQKGSRQRSNSQNRSFLQSKSVKSLNKNSSYSGLKNQSRLDKIMRLKVKPTYLKKPSRQSTQSKRQAMNSYLNSESPKSNKENNPRHQQSRLDKIMNIKVNKPKVNSTLINYQPSRVNTSFSSKKQKCNVSSIIEMKQCKNAIKKIQKQQFKEDRLWKLFERERQLRVFQDRKRRQSEIKQQRRRQKKFQTIVHKQVQKIQSQNQIKRRKNEGFADYIYPMY